MPMRRLAHDPGDPMVVSHCPMCGSGQVIGLPDGGISCEFCGMTFLVRIQPAYPGMPQSPLGPGAPSDTGPDVMEGGPGAMDQGIMPGEEGPPGMEDEEGGPPFGGPEDEGEEDEEEGLPGAEDEDENGGNGNVPPQFRKKKSSRTAGRNPDTPENRGHYARGWRASGSYGTSEVTPLERADLRGEPDAWYDGYMDYATSRPKWHSLTCPAGEHETDPACTLNQRQGARKTAVEELPHPRPDDMAAHLITHHGWTKADVEDARGAEGWDPGVLAGEHDNEHENSMDTIRHLHVRRRYAPYPASQLLQPSLSSRRYRTAAGDVLPEEAFIRHLGALHFGPAALRRAAHRVRDIRAHVLRDHGWREGEVAGSGDGQLRKEHDQLHRDWPGTGLHYAHPDEFRYGEEGDYGWSDSSRSPQFVARRRRMTA